MSAAVSVEAGEATKAEARADAALVRAIRERRVVKFIYKGFVRVGEPHAYGVSTTGEPLLLLFQTDGGSATRPPPGWRRFSAAQIEKIEVTDETFSAIRPGYTPEDPKLEPLWAAVK